MNSPKKEFLWWEKTVEYGFVIKHVSKFSKAVPLDGNYEKASDTIFKMSGYKWLLIEFKKDQDSIKNELDKFVEKDAAKDIKENVFEKIKLELQDESKNIHFIIYGELDKKLNDGTLTLVACQYFNSKEPIGIEEILSEKGMDEASFATYVKKFIEAKDLHKNKDGNTDKNTLFNYRLIGINKDDKEEIVIRPLVELDDFFDFSQELEMLDPQEDFSEPSFP